MPDLICPKCQSPMRSYERNGVTIDQCTGCRGLFLDRGELERLVDAEGSYYESEAAQAAPPPQQQQRAPDPQYREPTPRDYFGEQGGHRGHGGQGRHGKKRRKSFLEDLFD